MERNSSTVLKKSALSLSILLMKKSLGSPKSEQRCQALSVWTFTPSMASTTTTALSAASRARYVSAKKLLSPGVSIKKRVCFFHSKDAKAVPRDLDRFISSGSKSITVDPSSTLPMRVVALQSKSMDSTSDVFPQLECPTNATLRRFLNCHSDIHPPLLRGVEPPEAG